MKHEKTLRLLIKAAVDDTPSDQQARPFSGFMSGLIPEQLRTKEMRDNGITTIVLSGDERDMYYAAYNELRADRAVEYLNDKQLKDKLWYLVCETYVNRTEYKEVSKIKAKVQDFLSDLLLPLSEHEVLFKVHNFAANEHSIQLWDSSIKTYKVKDLKDWGFKSTVYYRDTLEKFKSSPLIAVREQGNNPSLVLERARKKAESRLRALQVYLSGRSFLHDEQLLFELSEEAAVKEVASSKIVLQSWTRGRRPILFEYHESWDNRVEEANRQYAIVERLQPKLRAAVERSIYWMGKSIVEADQDIKVADLCIAMESLLATKADKRKGEAIAYRMVLLEAAQEGNIRHPGEVLWIYKLRSTVVHGSGLEEATKSEYHTMLRNARETLRNYVNFVDSNNIQKPSALFKMLETSEHATTLLEWLRGFRDENSVELAEALSTAIQSHNPAPQEKPQSS